MSTSNVRGPEQSGIRDIVYAHIDTPVGPVWAAATDVGVCTVVLGASQPEVFFDRLSRYIDAEPPQENPEALASTLTQLREYFSRIRREFDLPLDIVYGTSFQRAVWKEVASIPYGTTATYGKIARHIGQPQAARAVGAALGANLLPILIPCHRVIGARDRLGYQSVGVRRRDSEQAPAGQAGAGAGGSLQRHQSLAPPGEVASPPPYLPHGRFTRLPLLCWHWNIHRTAC